GEEDPRAPAFGEDIRVLAIPAQARALRHRTIDHASRIDEHDRFLVAWRRKLADERRQLVESRANHLVVIVAPGIAGDASVRITRLRQVARRVCEVKGAQGDDRPRSRQQRLWIARYLGTLGGKPVHSLEVACADAPL